MAPLTVSNVGRLRPESAKILARLADRPWSTDFYLAGSAALTVYLGHREVRDLDFMGYPRLSSPERRDLLQDLLGVDPGVKVETARDGFLYVRFPPGAGHVAVRFFYYPYPLIDPEEEIAGMAVASATDLALMKLGAITSRGSRRDFVDLFALTREIPLRTLLERSNEKFGHVRDFPIQALKGLADIGPAAEESMSSMGVAFDWQEVEGWIQTEVRDLAREWVGFS